MAYDAEFYDGFDKYGPAGYVPSISDLGGEWTSLGGTGISAVIASALVGTGAALQLTASGTATTNRLSKTLAGNYARSVGGVTISSNLNASGVVGVVFNDGAVDQLAVAINSAGQIVAIRAPTSASVWSTGTVLGTASATVAANAPHCLEWDVTIHNTTGVVKLWLDGALVLSLTAQNTRGASSALNSLAAVAVSPQSATITVDHFYCWLFTAAGGSETPALTNPIIETQFPTSDSAAAFAFGAATVGQAYRTAANTASASAGNRMFLRRITPTVNCTISSVSVGVATANATPKIRPVIYSDSAGAPASVLSTGPEVTGVSVGLNTYALTTPQALTAGASYWIGFAADSATASIVFQMMTTGGGQQATITYPTFPSSPTLTSTSNDIFIFGNLTSAGGGNAYEVGVNPPLGDLSFVASSTVGAEDLFNMPGLVSSPVTIYSTAVKVKAERTDAGARTLNLEQKSGATTGTGTAAGLTPATAYGWLASYFDNDPATGVAWTASGVNNAKAGYKIAS